MRLYFVPDVVTLDSGVERHHAKYFKSRFQDGMPAIEVKHFGFVGAFLVIADVSVDQHLALRSYVDVLPIPALDAMIDTQGKLDVVVNALGSLKIPAGWVQIGHDYRYVLRVVLHLFLFAKRYYSNTGQKLVRTGLALDTVVSDIAIADRNDLISTADELGYDFSSVQANDTYGQALKKIVFNKEHVAIHFGGIEI